MSKEFQIRDGNLIASFDLENEDGDIDFCKLLKVSHGVADEIGMFVDIVATNKIIKDQSKQIADLEAKLAESEERIKDLEFRNKNLEHSLSVAPNANAGQRARIVELKGINHQLKQQLAEKDAELHQIYSHLGVEAFGEDIHEQALKEIAEKDLKIIELETKLNLKDKEINV